ncbi:hypothetical protein [Sandaracinobacteroides hominis]|uniref:hypothetical protein n=1 Tax=Sandaracinobacteroides hominis TaxID=2780086 RepID=UPI0018F5445F|nr:hypothetical protein [Sandaracinobacteroides hominis]
MIAKEVVAAVLLLETLAAGAEAAAGAEVAAAVDTTFGAADCTRVGRTTGAATAGADAATGVCTAATEVPPLGAACGTGGTAGLFTGADSVATTACVWTALGAVELPIRKSNVSSILSKSMKKSERAFAGAAIISSAPPKARLLLHNMKQPFVL